MSDLPPSWAKEIIEGEVDLDDLYDRCWSIARYNMPAASELDRVLSIRLTAENVEASRRLKRSVNKLNRDSSRVAWVAIGVAFVSLMVSVSGLINQLTATGESGQGNQSSSELQSVEISP